VEIVGRIAVASVRFLLKQINRRSLPSGILARAAHSSPAGEDAVTVKSHLEGCRCGWESRARKGHVDGASVLVEVGEEDDDLT
jgi:hypothetical protein